MIKFAFLFLSLLFIDNCLAQKVTYDNSGSVRSYTLQGRYWNTVSLPFPTSQDLLWRASTPTAKTRTSSFETNFANNYFTSISQDTFTAILPIQLSSVCQIMNVDAINSNKKLRVTLGKRADKHFVVIACQVE